MFVSVIFLSGGKGRRMKSALPKQYLPLGGKPIALHSFEVFYHLEKITEIITVCEPEFQKEFEWAAPKARFALPGKRRQDSVFQGFQKTSPNADLILIHDGARPFVNEESIEELISEGLKAGAAVLANPVSSTIKEGSSDFHVEKTLKREKLFAMQTPQALTPQLLKEGFALAQEKNITVTDDVQLAELLGKKIKLVMNSDRNLKITTPFDYLIAKNIYEKAL